MVRAARGAVPFLEGHNVFQKAVKYQAKGRVALIGPAGSGKSYTMLTLATLLAKGGRIAAIDTEHGSLSKYADLFDFEVAEMKEFTPHNFLTAMETAATNGFAVFCCDSLSHFWVGKGGALEYVDERNARSKDKMSGWKDFRPHERAMVDAMLSSPMHVLVTMRTKNDYVETTDEHGKKKRTKIGLAPVQREGLEYEFDLVGCMDDDNTLIVDKTRCPTYARRSLKLPGAKDFAPFAEWLEGSARPPKAVPAGPTMRQGHPAAESGQQPILPVSPKAIADLAQLLTELGGSEAQAVEKISPGKATLRELTADEAERLRVRLTDYRAKHPAVNGKVAV